MQSGFDFNSNVDVWEAFSVSKVTFKQFKAMPPVSLVVKPDSNKLYLAVQECCGLGSCLETHRFILEQQ